MNPEWYTTLIDYNYWARDRVWQCILTLDEEQFTRDLGYSWRSIHGQVVHTMSAEWIWFSRFSGVSPTGFLSLEDFPTREAVYAEWQTVEALARDFVQRLTPELLQSDLHYSATNGTPQVAPLWHLLSHVLNHSTDHRAQMLAMLHQLGAPSVEQDMIIYFRNP